MLRAAKAVSAALVVSSVLVVSSALTISSAQAAAVEPNQMVCSNGTSQTPCSVTLNNDALEVRVQPNLLVKARRLGRWSVSTQNGITTRSCNARVDLGNEVVYGVLRISSTTGTSLIWPQQRIDIPALKLSANSTLSIQSQLDIPSAQPGHP